MRDIPVFATPNGVATLILSQIPYTSEAYIKIRDSMDPEELLKECCDFCKAAGANTVYATGHPTLGKYPLFTDILSMGRLLNGLPNTVASLLPVTAENLEQWREIYNRRMGGVPAATFMTSVDARRHVEAGDAYFVYRCEVLIGIGIAAGDRIDCVASVVPGAGQDVILALCSALSNESCVLEVASENKPAVSLYQRLNFEHIETRLRWYRIYPE